MPVINNLLGLLVCRRASISGTGQKQAFHAALQQQQQAGLRKATLKIKRDVFDICLGQFSQ
jgi:hypothetical protein